MEGDVYGPMRGKSQGKGKRHTHMNLKWGLEVGAGREKRRGNEFVKELAKEGEKGEGLKGGRQRIKRRNKTRL